MTRCVTTFGEDKTTANELYRARISAGISLREAAEKIGVTMQELGHAEHGRIALGFERTEKLHAWYALANEKAGGMVVCATCGRITAALPRCVHCGKTTKVSMA